MDDINAMPNATQPKKKRCSRGRQRIEIKKLEVESKRQVTFSKRRKGLFKKADELSTLCGVEVGVLAISKAGRVFATDNAAAVVGRYRQESSSSDHHGINDSLKKQKEVEEQHIDVRFWLDQPIEELTTEKLVEYAAVLQELREKAAVRLDELRIQESSGLWHLVADQQVNMESFAIDWGLNLSIK